MNNIYNNTICNTILNITMTTNCIKNNNNHIIYDDDGDMIYEGELKNGCYDGIGIIYYKSGNKYEGEFKNGVVNGIGKYYDKNPPLWVT